MFSVASMELYRLFWFSLSRLTDKNVGKNVATQTIFWLFFRDILVIFIFLKKSKLLFCFEDNCFVLCHVRSLRQAWIQDFWKGGPGHAPPENFEKLKVIWCVFLAFEVKPDIFTVNLQMPRGKR